MKPEAHPQSAGGEPAATFREELRAIYQALDEEIARIGPVCELSGRCCRFAEYGHTLFLSEPEFVVLLNEAPPPSRPLDEGETCPWQNLNGRCTARESRPLGCRVYFCDPRYEKKAPELSERFLTKLKRLVDRYDLSWSYAPLHRHTSQARNDGRLSTPSISSVQPPGSQA